MRAPNITMRRYVHAVSKADFMELYSLFADDYRKKHGQPEFMDRHRRHDLFGNSTDVAYLGEVEWAEECFTPMGWPDGCFIRFCAPTDFSMINFYFSQEEMQWHLASTVPKLGAGEIILLLPESDISDGYGNLGVKGTTERLFYHQSVMLREHELRKNFSKLEQAAQEHFHRLEEKRKRMEANP
ncbi:MAG: hypothetical protein KJ709_04530 [Nanoarchaeota archaeon]|nr:hypothetical protein [Nanoarchaeota archaeon]